MAIENRKLEVGTKLVASYKKEAYVCTVEAAEEGEGVAFVLEDGTRHKSPSAAASKVMGGKAANGWRFWNLEGAESKAEAPVASEKPAKARKAIYRVPNQAGTPAGKIKFFCSACMKGFLVDEGTTPAFCPAGHDAQIGEPAAAAAEPQAVEV